jgi:hypothetical protein
MHGRSELNVFSRIFERAFNAVVKMHLLFLKYIYGYNGEYSACILVQDDKGTSRTKLIISARILLKYGSEPQFQLPDCFQSDSE